MCLVCWMATPLYSIRMNKQYDQLLGMVAPRNPESLKAFQTAWQVLEPHLSEREKQEFLIILIDGHYHHHYFVYFKTLLDIILHQRINLNFSIDHWAPTFLSLAIEKASRPLFDYLVGKGAQINFIGDRNLFDADPNLEDGSERYWTALDYATIKVADMMSIDYNYAVPESLCDCLEESNEQIVISKALYCDLLEQAVYLQKLIRIDNIADHIASIGGKHFHDLPVKRHK